MNRTSGRLIFSRFSPDDFPLYARLAMNEEVMKYITGKALNREETEQRFQHALDAGIADSETGFFIVRSKQHENLIGVAKLVRMDKNQAEVGYMLLPEHWRQGFASEMVECMINLAKEQKINKLIGIVDPGNPASIRVLTKFGFELAETGQIDGLEAAYYKLHLSE